VLAFFQWTRPWPGYFKRAGPGVWIFLIRQDPTGAGVNYDHNVFEITWFLTRIKQEQESINFVQSGVTPEVGVNLWNTGVEKIRLHSTHICQSSSYQRIRDGSGHDAGSGAASNSDYNSRANRKLLELWNKLVLSLLGFEMT